MRYYIADLHFYHESLNARMDCRGFADGSEMNAYMIRQWNKRVRPNDEVVILGDLSVGKGKATNAIVEQLNGKLCLVEGNHDLFLNDRLCGGSVNKRHKSIVLSVCYCSCLPSALLSASLSCVFLSDAPP